MVTEKRNDFELIRANVGLLDFYGSGLTYSLVVSCIVIHIFTWDVSNMDGNHANICWTVFIDMSG